MRTIIIGSAVGLGWIAISYAMEPLFPMGDWRWLVLSIIAFGTAGVTFALGRSYRPRRRPFLKVRKPDPEQVKRAQALAVLATRIRNQATSNRIVEKMIDEELEKQDSRDETDA